MIINLGGSELNSKIQQLILDCLCQISNARVHAKKTDYILLLNLQKGKATKTCKYNEKHIRRRKKRQKAVFCLKVLPTIHR